MRFTVFMAMVFFSVSAYAGCVDVGADVVCEPTGADGRILVRDVQGGPDATLFNDADGGASAQLFASVPGPDGSGAQFSLIVGEYVAWQVTNSYPSNRLGSTPVWLRKLELQDYYVYPSPVVTPKFFLQPETDGLHLGGELISVIVVHGELCIETDEGRTCDYGKMAAAPPCSNLGDKYTMDDGVNAAECICDGSDWLEMITLSGAGGC